jgi:hypothetical protein
MRVAAKWFIIGWTLICLAGGAFTCFYPAVMAAHDQSSGKVITEQDKEAQALAVGGCATCGVVGWFVVWVVGAIPGLVFYFIGKPTSRIVQEDYGRDASPVHPAVLCKSCGKYNSGGVFCPNCGQQQR